jgi:hypothetical protein
MSILTILLVLLIAGILCWGVLSILNAPNMPLGEPFKTILKVVFIVLIVLFALQCAFGVLPGVPHLRL